MAMRWRRITVTTASAGLILPGAGLAAQAHASPAAPRFSAHCSAGAHTLAPPGAHLYPETGNGGYTSVHTLVHLVYDAQNRLPLKLRAFVDFVVPRLRQRLIDVALSPSLEQRGE